MVQLLWEAVWRFLRKVKIELPYDPAIPLLGIYPDKTLLHFVVLLLAVIIVHQVGYTLSINLSKYQDNNLF